MHCLALLSSFGRRGSTLNPTSFLWLRPANVLCSHSFTHNYRITHTIGRINTNHTYTALRSIDRSIDMQRQQPAIARRTQTLSYNLLENGPRGQRNGECPLYNRDRLAITIYHERGGIFCAHGKYEIARLAMRSSDRQLC